MLQFANSGRFLSLSGYEKNSGDGWDRDFSVTRIQRDSSWKLRLLPPRSLYFSTPFHSLNATDDSTSARTIASGIEDLVLEGAAVVITNQTTEKYTGTHAHWRLCAAV